MYLHNPIGGALAKLSTGKLESFLSQNFPFHGVQEREKVRRICFLGRIFGSILGVKRYFVSVKQQPFFLPN